MKLRVKAFALSAVVASMMAAGQVYAHTELLDEDATITEGQAKDLRLGINHGCEQANGSQTSVIAESVVIPAAIAKDSAGNDALVSGNLIGLIRPVIPTAFPTIAAKTNAIDPIAGVIAFSGRGASMLPQYKARTVMQVTAPSFNDFSCAQSVTVQLAVADICSTNNPKIRAGKVNLWMPALTGGPANGIVAQAAAQAAAGAPLDGYGNPSGAIKVLRDLVANPLPSSCAAGEDVVVSPTTAEVNAGLPIVGFW